MMSDAELRHVVGKAARSARLRLGLTQADVAERVNLASEVYGRLERGIMLPSVPTLRRLSLALNVSVDELLVLKAEGSGPVRPPLAEEDPRDLRRLLQRARALNPAGRKILGLIAALLGRPGLRSHRA